MKRLSILLLCILCGAVTGFMSPLYAQSVVSSWEPSGTVNAVIVTGNTVYIGGDFTSLVPSTSATGYGAFFSKTTGKADTTFPRINGAVRCILPDGANGFYIGGSFTEVGNAKRNGVVHIHANGSLDPWNPNVDGSVGCMVRRGDTIYFGGNFSSIGGQTRYNIGAAHATTGTLLAWNPTVSNSIYSMCATGNTLFIGGYFTSVNGQSRQKLASFDLSTGNLTSWNPGTDGYISSMHAFNNEIFVGGNYTTIAGVTRSALCVLDATTGTASALDFSMSTYNEVFTFLQRRDTLFVAGNFSSIGGQSRQYLAALNITTGSVLGWQLSGNSTLWITSLAEMGDTLIMGGGFNGIGATTRNFIASVNITTGSLTAWDPNVNNTVYAVGVSATGVYAGGLFTGAGSWIVRNRLAAFDLSTGEPTSWAPAVNYTVNTLAESNGLLYLGGSFGLVNGQSRYNLAAVETGNGALSNWAPDPNCTVYSLAIKGGVVFIGGCFTSIGGQPHNKLAAVSVTSGTLMPWSPEADNTVLTLAEANGVVYAGGDFATINGQTRTKLGAISATTGTLLPWAPTSISTVNDLLVVDTLVYPAGQYTSLNGQNRYRLGAVTATTGTLTAWNPVFSGSVNSIDSYNGVLYAGGEFASAGGKQRNYLAAVSSASNDAVVLPWNGNADGSIRAVVTSPNRVIVAGSFSRIAGVFKNNFAILTTYAPATQLVVSGITPATPAGKQQFDITVETRTATGEPMSVTQATVVGVQFFHPALSVLAGSTQATIAADQRSTTITLTLDNTALVQITTTITVSTLNNTLTSTSQNISILPPPPASRLAVAMVTPTVPLSDQTFTITVESRNSNNNTLPVTQATIVNLAFSHPQLALISGSLQSTIKAGSSSTTFTITVRNTGTLLVSTTFTISSGNSSLQTISQTISIEPGPSRLLLRQVDSFAYNAQLFTLTVETRSSNNLIMPVTQATVVGVQFSHPSLGFAFGSTQATIAPGETSATLSFALHSASAAVLSTTLTVGSLNGQLASTTVVITVKPGPSQLLVQQADSTLFHMQPYTLTVQTRNVDNMIMPVTQATTVGVQFSHPALSLLAGSTQAVITPGNTTATLSFTLASGSTTAFSTTFTVTSLNGSLATTTLLVRVEPAADRLIVQSVFPATPYSGQVFTLLVESRNSSGIISPVTSATALAVSFSNPNLALAGSIQAAIEAGRSSTSISITVINSSSSTISTVFGIAAGNLLLSTGAIISILPAPTGFSYPTLSAWLPNNMVNAFALSGDTLYLGGSFTSLIEPSSYTGYGVLLSTTTSTISPNFPFINGIVYTAAPDGNGGLYIGGYFSKVGPQSRTNIARINADGTLHPWNPSVNSTVTAIYVTSNTIYIGGSFSSAGGQSRNRLAAFSATSGTVLSWNPTANSQILSLTGNASAIYVSGYFTSISGTTRNYVAAIDATTGTVLPCNPNPNSYVYSLALGGDTLYAAGSFTSIGGSARSYLVALNATTGSALPWNPAPNSYVQKIFIDGTTLYAGGYFSLIGGQNRSGLAAFTTTTGTITTWNPSSATGIIDMTVLNGIVYTGGSFTTVAGQSRNYLAAFDATTGALTSWKPNPNSSINVLLPFSSGLFAGGNFNGVGTWVSRNYIAALHATTGEPLAWTANASSSVQALELTGTTLYVGGNFGAMNGQTRNYLAALDATNGTLLPWNPNANNSVYALAVRNGAVYTGGHFTTMGGQTRNKLAALDATNGTLLPWDPNVNDAVFTLAMAGDTVYAGGFFTSVGGQARNKLAAINATTGTVTSWNPNSNSTIRSLIVTNGTVYAGGDFTTIGGQARNYLAAIDKVTGTATAWNPASNSSVYALARSGSTIYAGGYFTSIGGLTPMRVAALTTEVNTANALPWRPDADNFIQTLLVRNNTVYIGGSFQNIGGIASPNFAILSGYVPAHHLTVSTASVSASHGQSIAITVQVRAATGQLAGVTQATVVGLNFIHPNLTIVSGSTQATIPAGQSSTVITCAFGNTTNIPVTTAILVTPVNSTLTSTGLTLTVQPPAASRLAVTSVTTPVSSGAPVIITVESRTFSNAVRAVTQATTVAVTFSHPNLVQTGGTTQTVLAAGQSSTTITVILANTSNSTASSLLTVSAAGSSLTSTSAVVTVQAPPVSRLAVTGITPPSPANSASFTIQVETRNSNNLVMPVTQATIVGVTFSHPALSLVSGITQATIAPGSSSTTLTIAINNSDVTAITTTMSINAVNSSLTGAQYPVTIQACSPFTVAINAAGGSNICKGNSVQLTASTGATWYWSNGSTSQSITVSPATTTSYTLTVATVNGCTASTGITISVFALPQPAINGTASACPNTAGHVYQVQNVTGNTYSWTVHGGIITSGQNTNSISVSWASQSMGIVMVTEATQQACAATTSLSVSLSASLAVAITPNGPTNFCAGNSVMLQATAGYATYLWSNGATSASITATTTGNYVVTVTDTGGCVGTSQTVAVTVQPSPTAGITANGPTIFCAGGSVQLTSTTAATYLWSNGATSQSITVSPAVTTVYSVTVANLGGCTASSTVTVTVYPQPVATIVPGGPTAFCQGGSVQLTAGTAATYQWSNGATTQSITVSPAVTTIYTVTVATAYGCTAVATQIVGVYDRPVASITPTGPTSFCVGETVQLTAGTAATYQWSNGATTQSITVSPTATTLYTVTVAGIQGCNASTTQLITVYDQPVASITPNGSIAFCIGEAVQLTAGTAATYRWSNGATTQSITVSPTATTLYTVTVANVYGCSTTAAKIVTVYDQPVASIAPNGPVAFCVGGAVQLTAGTAATYRWSNGATTQSITVSPTATTLYTVTVANIYGCTAAASQTVTIHAQPQPVISGANSSCPNTGGHVYQTPALSGSTYDWSVNGGQITSGQGSPTVTVTWNSSGNGEIAINQTSLQGCAAYTSLSVSINASLTPIITPSGPTTFCDGNNVTLEAGAGYASYLWSNGAVTPAIVVSTSGTYLVTVTDAGGCNGTSQSVMVTVQSVPVATAGQDVIICATGGAQLQASGGVSYVWSPSEGLSNPLIANPVAQPTHTTTYIVAVQNATGCESRDTITVTVQPLKLDVSVLLEGAYNGGGTMTSMLASTGYLPGSQPYNTAPFNYAGTESISVIPGSAVDWVLLELRSTTAASSVVTRRAALLRNNGKIVDLDGISPVSIPAGTVLPSSFYIVVYHRNHLAVMSALQVQAQGSCTAAYNFTTAQTQAYTTFSQPMKDLGAGVYGMLAGEVVTDGIINAWDRVTVRNNTGALGYLNADVTLNSLVSAEDRILTYNNKFKISEVP